VAFWVGIGGDPQLPLYQLGSETQCVNGVAYNSLWYEAYPNPARVWSYNVLPGDKISPIINMTTSPGLMGLENGRTGQKFYVNIPYDPKSSVEWIVEAPTLYGSIETLADFDPVVLQLCSADNGAVLPGNGPAMTMKDPNGGAATVSAPTLGNSLAWSPRTEYFTVRYASQ
jgi:hypothetical protein